LIAPTNAPVCLLAEPTAKEEEEEEEEKRSRTDAL
jgi:hypothetical protein